MSDEKQGELKACPFCGGKPERGQIAKNHHSVRCSVCHIGTRMIPLDEANARWNTRPTADDSAVVVALRILMDDLGGRVLQSGTVCAVKIACHALDAHDKRQQTPAAPVLCPHCGSTILWSEDRGAHCDGCDELHPNDIAHLAQPAAPVEDEPRNGDEDTMGDMKAVWERGHAVDLFSGMGEDEWFTRTKADKMPMFYSPVSHYRITAKHADTFDPDTMDRETWARAAIARGMV